METKKEKYNRLRNQFHSAEEHINKLKENPFVRRYMELCEETDDLYRALKKVYKEMKMEEFENCKHICVICNSDYDRYEGRTDISYGCVKCGLDQRILDTDRRILSTNERVF